ncbi:MAG: hypothetical protein ACFFGZ_06300 [Candidatus Thorarchaeota archaeon]
MKRSIQALAVNKGDWIIIAELELAADGVAKNLLAKIVVDKDALKISPAQKEIVRIPVGDTGKIMICWKVRPEEDQATVVAVSLVLDEGRERVISTTLQPKAASFKENLH